MGKALLLLLTLLLVLAACGSDPDPVNEFAPAPAKLRMTIGGLAPPDAQVLVQFAPHERLMEVLGLFKGFSGGHEPVDPIETLALDMGVPLTARDLSRRSLVAFRFEGTGEPHPTLIVPFLDEPSRPKGVSRHEYVALSNDWWSGGSKLAAGLLGGDISMRIDVPSMARQFGPQIDETLGLYTSLAASFAAGSSPLGGALGKYFDSIDSVARGLLDSTETLDLAIRADGAGRLHLAIAQTRKAGDKDDDAAPSTHPLGAMAAHLPPELPLRILIRVDPALLAELLSTFVDPLVRIVPEEDRGKMRSIREELVDVLQRLGEEWALAADFRPREARILLVNRCEQAAGVVDALVALRARYAADSGTVTSEEPREVAGLTVRRFRIDGRPGDLLLGTGPARLVVGLNLEDEVVSAAMKTRQTPESIARQLARVPGELGFFMSIQDDATGPVTMVVGTEGRVTRVVASFDSKALPDNTPSPDFEPR